MSRYAFALKPKWILGHVIVIAMIVGFVSAGMWQIRRMHARETYNHAVVANMTAPVAPLDDVLGPSAKFGDVPPQLNRRVTATGRYLIDQEVVINAQASPDSIPGVWIVSPLQLADGRVLLVNRGWLPSTAPLTSVPVSARPPAGEVTVSGYVSETEPKTEGESAETNHARQGSFLRIDIARIQRQFTEPLVPAFLLRQGQQPADPGRRPPQNLATPTLSSGPHLGYVMQWFGFTLLAIGGYATLLWVIGRDNERKMAAPPPPAEADLPPGAFIDADGVIDVTGVHHVDDADRTGSDVPTRS